MVSEDNNPTVEYLPEFRDIIGKLKEPLKSRVKKQIKKIVNNPKVGKPMRYGRKGTREVYVGSFRLSYFYLENENKIQFADLYHKDHQ